MRKWKIGYVRTLDYDRCSSQKIPKERDGERGKRERGEEGKEDELTCGSTEPPPPTSKKRSSQAHSLSSDSVDVSFRFGFRRGMIDHVQDSFHEEGSGVGEEDG